MPLRSSGGAGPASRLMAKRIDQIPKSTQAIGNRRLRRRLRDWRFGILEEYPTDAARAGERPYPLAIQSCSGMNLKG